MRRYLPVLKEYGFWNLAACLLQLTAPLVWTSPFASAFLAAAGYGGLSVLSVLPGAVLGAALGKGGFGAAAGGMLACAAGRFLKGRDPERARTAAAGAAFVLCLLPSLSYHTAGGAYDMVSCVLSAIAAMAACPVLMPFVSIVTAGRMYLNEEERTAFFLLVCLMLAGSMRLFSPVGYFLIGLFALFMSDGGLFSALVGALSGGAAMLFGNAGGAEIAVIFLTSAGAGALCGRSAALRAGLFLLGLPLGIYLGAERESLFLFASAALYPWVPRAYRACFLRYVGFYRDHTRRNFSALCARRHVPRAGMRVSGDSGCIENFENGRMLFMLADGMGTGEAARRISARAVSWAKEIFPSALAPSDFVKCINALCREDGNCHTTMDVCALDLITGRAHFIKSGAEPTWILRKAGIARVEGEALPLGVLPDAPGSVKSAMLAPGDVIFMATDGLIWALGGEENTEKALLSLKALSPGDLCAEMIKKARAVQRGKYKDDMSCLCVRIDSLNGARSQARFLAPPEAERRKAG